MTKYLIIFLCSFGHLPGQTSADNLKDLYTKSTTGPDSINHQTQFFNAFPNTFKDFNNLYGYLNKVGQKGSHPGPLYSQAFEHVQLLFRLTKIPQKDFYSKIIGITIGGHWDADAISYLQMGLQTKVLANPKIAVDLLQNKPDKYVESFWFFFFSGPHPPYKTVPNELLSLESYDKRMYGLIQKGLNNAIKRSGH